MSDSCLHGRGVVHQVLEAQMKEDMADKESLESKRAQHQEEAREKCKLISEQKAVRLRFHRDYLLLLLMQTSSRQT